MIDRVQTRLLLKLAGVVVGLTILPGVWLLPWQTYSIFVITKHELFPDPLRGVFFRGEGYAPLWIAWGHYLTLLGLTLAIVWLSFTLVRGKSHLTHWLQERMVS